MTPDLFLCAGIPGVPGVPRIPGVVRAVLRLARPDLHGRPGVEVAFPDEAERDALHRHPRRAA